jgi:GTPase SAR1 family protein
MGCNKSKVVRSNDANTARVQPEYKFTMLLVGNSGVGKTSLLLRFVENTFSTETSGIATSEFRFKTLAVDGTSMKLEVNFHY